MYEKQVPGSKACLILHWFMLTLSKLTIPLFFILCLNIFQCAKLLGNVSVLTFYPSKFVLVTELLSTFGEKLMM